MTPAAALAVAGALWTALHRPAPPPEHATTHRLAPAPGATVPGLATLEGEVPRIEEVEAGRDRRLAIVFTAPGRWSLAATVPGEGSLRFALRAQAADAALALRLEAADTGETLHEERVARARRWSERHVDVARLAGRGAGIDVALEGRGSVALAHPELVGRTGEPRPNVILYVVDCLRADHVGAYGYTRSTTPHLDRLARDGIVFERVNACASWTKPAVGCLFTSRYPLSHGARTVDDVLDPAPPTLAEAFRDAGYATAAWIANPFVATRAFGLTRGFDRVVQTVDKPPVVNINDLPADAADITDRVLPWLEENADRRFFAYLHSLDLHAQYRRRPPFDRLFLTRDRRGEQRQVDLYDNELAYNDRELGRLFEALTRLGLADRTIVAVTADHGEEFGDHGFTRHGHTLYQGLLHVPFVLRLPGSLHRGARVDVLASSLDVAPTLLDFAGVPRPPGFEGLSLRPAAEGREAPPRAAVFAEQLSPKEVLYAARSERYKAVAQLLPEAQDLLFDLDADPGETRNLLPEVPEGARGLLADLRRFLQLGQEGYHLAFAPGAPTARLRLQATTDGVFADVQRFAMAAGETLSVSSDRRRVDYTFAAGPAARHAVLRTDPPGTPVRVSVALDGRALSPAAVSLGATGRRPEAMPFVADSAEVRVGPDEASALSVADGAVLRVWYVSAPPERKALLDPELTEELRALGYIQ